jgi:hypothetical protein
MNTMKRKQSKEYHHQWYLKNRTRLLALAKEWKAANPGADLEYMRRWRKANPERNKATALKARIKRFACAENRITHTLGQARRRSAESGLAFDIDLSDLLPLPQICPVFGIVLNYKGTGGRGFFMDSPSIDRIDSSKGYIHGNVRVISWRANRLKADATLQELKMLVAYLEQHIK